MPRNRRRAHIGRQVTLDDVLNRNEDRYFVNADEELIVISPYRLGRLITKDNSSDEKLDSKQLFEIVNAYINEHKEEIKNAPRPKTYLAFFDVEDEYINREVEMNINNIINVLGRCNDCLYVPNHQLSVHKIALKKPICFLKKEYLASFGKNKEVKANERKTK